jgi:hypothetical protein
VVRMPSSAAARITRTAISPRLATRSLILWLDSWGRAEVPLAGPSEDGDQ